MQQYDHNKVAATVSFLTQPGNEAKAVSTVAVIYIKLSCCPFTSDSNVYICFDCMVCDVCTPLLTQLHVLVLIS